MQTTNKSINFQSDRGNDIYKEREVIRIKLDAGSAPLVNTSDSYLTFSLKMGENRAYMIPEPMLGGCPIETIQIYDGNEATLLEQMDSVGLWSCMKNYYGNNANDDQLQSIYEGRGRLQNDLYESGGEGAGQRAFATNANGVNPNRGGGFGSQYYQIDNNAQTADNARKCQIIYRFPMSGLLSAMKTELLPLVVLNGLVLKITLMEGAKFLRLQQVQNYQRTNAGIHDKRDPILVGYADLDQTTGAQAFDPQAAPNAHLYLAQNDSYSLHGYIDSAGAVQNAGIPDVATNAPGINGVILKLAADGPDAQGVADIRNLALKVGGYVALGPNCHPAAGAGARAGPAGPLYVIPNPITSIQVGAGNRIEVRFATYTNANMTVGDNARANLFASQNNPICAAVENYVKTDYEVSDIQMVCNVVQAPPAYIETMVRQAASGQLKIQYNSYRDERVNITNGALSNEIFIPSDLQRIYCVLAVNEVLGNNQWFLNSFKPTVENLFNYQWIIDGTNVPNIPVSLKRLAEGKVSPLQIIELEKALDESSIRIRNIQNPSDFGVIGRRMGAYGDSISLLDKILKCRINFDGPQVGSLLYHFWIYHTKTIMFEGGARVVVE